jgi:hypothetical protein
MRLFSIMLVLVLLAPLLSGCSSTAAQQDDGRPHAECTVCKQSGDLACIDVAVDDKTPRCTHDGKTFFFCSEQCCRKFKKTPAKFEKE